MANIIQTGQVGIAGAAFGGSDRSSLYLTDGSAIVKVLTATLTDTPDSNSLYKVTGLGAKGKESTYFTLPKKYK